MKLYLLTQDHVRGYDTFDAVVVAAESEEDARNIHPHYPDYVTHIKDGKWMWWAGHSGIEHEHESEDSGWVRYCDIDKIEVEYLGETHKERGVILASFNAG